MKKNIAMTEKLLEEYNKEMYSFPVEIDNHQKVSKTPDAEE
ncbi:hypothetical protein [Clostridium sp. 1xD42-85]|nr:hypothetical protein [Clostridium sp. 1xD42-85]